MFMVEAKSTNVVIHISAEQKGTFVSIKSLIHTAQAEQTAVWWLKVRSS